MSIVQHTNRRPWRLMIMDNNYEGIPKVLQECLAEELTVTQALGDIGSFSATVRMPPRRAAGASPTETLSSLLPYYFDWRIQRTDVPSVQFGGIIEEVEYNFDERTVNIAGRDYTSALDNRIWYFDPADPVGNWYPDSAVGWPRRTDFVVQDILTNTFSRTGSVPITYSGHITGTPPSILYGIGVADSETIYSKIKALSEQSNGFDFLVDYTRTFHLWYPTMGTTTPTFELEQGRNCQYSSVRISQGGVTRTIVIGTNLTSRSGYTSGPGGATGGAGPRLKEALIDLGDVDDNGQISSYATAEAARQAAPLREMTVKLLPNVANEVFWSSVSLGDTVRMIPTTDIAEPTINKRVVSFEIALDESGIEEVTLGLDEPTLSL